MNRKTITGTLRAAEFPFDEYFQGVWHEQARTENRFEDGCVWSIADYSVQQGVVQINNTCVTAEGTHRMGPRMTARKRVLQRQRASYRVSVFGFPAGVYNVLLAEEVADPARGIAVVAGSTWKRVWVLTRSAHPDPATVLAALERAVPADARARMLFVFPPTVATTAV